MSSATKAKLASLYGARGSLHSDHSGGDGAQTASNPNTNRQAISEGVINSTITQKRTKAMDMQFHWPRDRECQQQFRMYWRPGKQNYADYWTKHHSPTHHKSVRREFISPLIQLELLQQRVAQHRALAVCAAQKDKEERAAEMYDVHTSSHEGVMI